MSLAQAVPGYTPTQWATAQLAAFGAPVNATNVDSLVRWANAESGGYSPNSAGGKYNPLNVVTQSNDKHTGAGGSQGNIADFGSLADGVAATARLFTGNKNAAGILAGLRATDQPATFTGIQRFYGTWGGSINFGAAPPNTSTGTPGTSSGSGSGSGSATTPPGAQPAVAGCPEGNLITFPGPIPNISHCNGRALLGAASIAAGVALIALAASFALKGQLARAALSTVGVSR